MPRPTPPLPDSAAVVVIGGGVIGTSAAFHLAEAGVDVVLVERGQLGSGSTCRAAGGVRTQFSDLLNIEIAKRSLAAFREFNRRPGWEIDLKRVGYLFVLTRASDLDAFDESVALQKECGLDSRIVTAGEARGLCPLLEGEDILAGAFSPGDGHATPEGVVQGYAFAARALHDGRGAARDEAGGAERRILAQSQHLGVRPMDRDRRAGAAPQLGGGAGHGEMPMCEEDERERVRLDALAADRRENAVGIAGWARVHEDRPLAAHEVRVGEREPERVDAGEVGHVGGTLR